MEIRNSKSEEDEEEERECVGDDGRVFDLKDVESVRLPIDE